MQFSLLTILSATSLAAALAVPVIPSLEVINNLPALSNATTTPALPILKDVAAVEKRCSAWNKVFNPCVCPSQWGKNC